MAHRILGLDIGQRVVKVAVVDKTLRNSTLSAFEMEPVAAPYEEEQQREALGRLLSRTQRPDDVIVAGLPVAEAMYRVLRFPFSDDKSLRESVPFELESHIPIEIDQVVVDHAVLTEGAGGEIESEVLAVGMPRTIVEARLSLLKEIGAEPRRLCLKSLCLSSVLAGVPVCAEGTTMLLDIGASSTEAVVYEGGLVRFLRSLSVGSDTVRERFVSQFNVDGTEGDLLVSHTLLMPPDMAPTSPNERVLYDATEAGIAPWLREVRQTMAVWGRGGRTRPDRLLLTGGMARMRGLVEYVEAVLQIPVQTLSLQDLPSVTGPSHPDLGDFGAVALALALQGTESRAPQEMDFRQGDLAYEGDFKFLRKRLPQMAAFAVIVLCLLGVRTTIEYRALMHEQARQHEQLRTFSKQLTEKEFRSFSKFEAELGRKPKVDLASYYPDITAIRALDDITALLHKVTEPPEFKPSGPAAAYAPQPQLAQLRPRMQDPQMGGVGTFAPPRGGVQARVRLPTMGDARGVPAGAPEGDRGPEGGPAADEQGEAPFSGHKVELLSADIDRSKATLRGDCDTQEALLAFQQAIERHRCFSKVKSSSDRITFERHRDWFRFNLRFEVSCPTVSAKKAAKGEAGSGAKGGKGGKNTKAAKGKATDEDDEGS